MLRYNEFINEARNNTKIKSDPLIESAKKGSSSVVKNLIKNGHNLNVTDDDYNRTALMYACLNSYLMIVKFLVDAEANVNMQDYKGRTALMMCKTPKIYDILLNAGADVNIKNNLGDTAIMDIVSYSTHDSNLLLILQKFLKYGLDLSIKNKLGLNFYDKLKEKDIYPTVEEYMDENFPEYKDEWEMKQNITKYNL